MTLRLLPMVLGLFCLCHIPLLAQDLNGARLVQAAQEPPNWLTDFGAYNGWRYNSLQQINRDKVKTLTPAWAFQTGKIEGGLNATPQVFDGVLYLVGSFNRVFALNAATGERLLKIAGRFVLRQRRTGE